MKILLCNRDERGHVGGDMILLRNYQKSLQKMGYEADYMSNLHINTKMYDMVWLFHINFGWVKHQWKSAVDHGTPYCVFSIFYPGLYSDTDHDTMEKILYGAKMVFCSSKEEEMLLLQEFPKALTVVIDNGVDKEVFKNRNPENKVERDFVMAASARGGKGEKRIEKACQELGLPFKYFQGLSQEELAHVYSIAKVYVCGSDSERNNLMVLEAAACGTTVVDSVHNMAYPLHDFLVANPLDHEDLKEKIKQAWDNPTDMSDRVRSWDDVVREILNVL